jgi:hypothetical protein
MENITIIIDKLEDMHKDINETKKAVELLSNDLTKILNSYKQEMRTITENQEKVIKSLRKK